MIQFSSDCGELDNIFIFSNSVLFIFSMSIGTVVQRGINAYDIRFESVKLISLIFDLV